MRRRLLALLVLLAAAAPAWSVIEVYQFQDPQQEARFKRLTQELRCLVCQNQNIADSNADLAKDLRQEVYEMIVAGKRDEEIIGFLTARYGDFVLYRPPFKATTALLWVGPFVLVVVGVVVLIHFVRSRQRAVPAELSPEERARLEALLAGRDGEERR
ncbi:cytochrome c-type biogenesis protein [Inmirania thermothiophila]|uniref:Cytochrome c-type biogenesis protein n=1 Tax=Inmirania thermothiophila TaxID=1750597 RepID=A0A3N1XS77_9GAMM|nr:cytochrome c-type biogenesis protein [Inmirania thermothiophila]ROR29485.1 cytochrome c-type biogenesis protein CcmH [Inmirania thermothiophila]